METTAMTNNDVVVDFFVSLGITSERGGTNDFFFISFSFLFAMCLCGIARKRKTESGTT
jgi:hypothetical protein